MKTNRILAAMAVLTGAFCLQAAAEPLLTPRAKDHLIRTVPGTAQEKEYRAPVFNHRGDLVLPRRVAGVRNDRNLVRENRNLNGGRAAQTFRPAARAAASSKTAPANLSLLQ